MTLWTSLVVLQGTWVPWSGRIPRAAEQLSLCTVNYWACALELGVQLLSPCTAATKGRGPGAWAPPGEATAMGSPRAATKSSSRLPRLENTCMQQQRPSTAKNKYFLKSDFYIQKNSNNGQYSATHFSQGFSDHPWLNGFRIKHKWTLPYSSHKNVTEINQLVIGLAKNVHSGFSMWPKNLHELFGQPNTFRISLGWLKRGQWNESAFTSEVLLYIRK